MSLSLKFTEEKLCWLYLEIYLHELWQGTQRKLVLCQVSLPDFLEVACLLSTATVGSELPCGCGLSASTPRKTV